MVDFAQGLAYGILAFALGVVIVCSVFGDDWPARQDAAEQKKK